MGDFYEDGVFTSPVPIFTPIQNLRKNRNKLLASSDWTGLSDTALTSEASAKWELYRQALRDLPTGLDTVDKVNAVTWPTKPS
jgi:hypothetical protein